MRRRSNWRLALHLSLIMLLVLAQWPAYAGAEGSAAAPNADTTVSVLIPKEDEKLFSIISQVRELVRQYYTKDVPDQQIYQGVLKGMLEALGDPYSQYLTQDELDSLSTSIEGEYSGIGVTIESASGNIRVVATFEGSPAARKGIQAGDLLLSADGVDFRGKTTEDVSKVLRGEPGTQVTLTVLRPSTGETFTLNLTRETIVQQTLSIKDLGDGKFYIKISQFTSDTAKQFPVVMKYLSSRGMKGLVLDLRDNPGGLLESCVEIASQLVPKGPIVELRRKELKQTISNDQDTSTVPIVVLVNGGSASASEILAGAIRDRGVGILIGEPTFGKACVQSIIPLGDNLGGVRLTIADYYTPSGYNLAGKGLEPAIPVKQERVTPPEGIDLSRTLSSGMVGLDVQRLQQTLAFLGFDPGPADGVFGKKTEAALNSFLASNGMTPSGQVTKAVADALQNAVNAKVKDAPDNMLSKASEVLSTRFTTGHW